MKLKYKEKTGEYVIVLSVVDASVDSEATKARIAALVKPEMNDEQTEKLYLENLVYSRVGPECELIEDDAAEIIRQKLKDMGPNKLLLDSGEYIADYRGTEYWIKKEEKWAEEKIEEIGVSLPGSAILQGDLTKEQQEEISLQKETERIASLPADEKAEEKRQKLYVLARQANQKAEDAELLGEAFDKLAWFEPQKQEIEALYA